MGKKGKADLHRLIKKADGIVEWCIVASMALLIPVAYLDWLLYGPWYTTCAVYGIIATCALYALLGTKFIAVIEWASAFLISMAALPFIVLVFGISTVPRYYKYWFELVLSLHKARG